MAVGWSRRRPADPAELREAGAQQDLGPEAARAVAAPEEDAVAAAPPGREVGVAIPFQSPTSSASPSVGRVGLLVVGADPFVRPFPVMIASSRRAPRSRRPSGCRSAGRRRRHASRGGTGTDQARGKPSGAGARQHLDRAGRHAAARGRPLLGVVVAAARSASTPVMDTGSTPSMPSDIAGRGAHGAPGRAARPGRAHVDTAAPGFTHLQHAQPVSFGHQLASTCTRSRATSSGCGLGSARGATRRWAPARSPARRCRSTREATRGRARLHRRDRQLDRRGQRPGLRRRVPVRARR